MLLLFTVASFLLGIVDRLDVVFAVDGSQDVDTQTFMKFKDFLNGTLSAYTISNKKTRIGLLAFGDKVRRVLKLEDGAFRPIVQQAVFNLKPVGGKRHLADALKFASSGMFDKFSPTDRGKSIVLITASSPSRKGFESELKSSLDDLNKQKIRFMVVALDRKQDDEELAMIKKNNVVIDLANTDQLQSALTPVLDESGKAAGESVFS